MGELVEIMNLNHDINEFNDVRMSSLYVRDVLAANSDNLRLLLDIEPPNNLASATDIVMRHYHSEQRIRTLSQNLTHNTQKPNEIHNREPPVSRPQYNYLPTYKPVYPTHVSMAPRFNSYTPSFPPNPNFYQRPAYHQQYVQPSIPKPQFPSQAIPIQTRPANNQRFFTNQQVFGKPKTPSNVFPPRNSNKPNGESPSIEDYDYQYSYSEPPLTNDTYQQLLPEPYLEYLPSETYLTNEQFVEQTEHQHFHEDSDEGTEIDDVTFGESPLRIPTCITRVENQ
ncbi:hypothetical protein Trydic_g8490 [Trypoxylus dichotomus]